MDMRGYQRYREDALNTMTQGELLLLLYDELIKRLMLAILMTCLYLPLSIWIF